MFHIIFISRGEFLRRLRPFYFILPTFKDNNKSSTKYSIRKHIIFFGCFISNIGGFSVCTLVMKTFYIPIFTNVFLFACKCQRSAYVITSHRLVYFYVFVRVFKRHYSGGMHKKVVKIKIIELKKNCRLLNIKDWWRDDQSYDCQHR